MTIDHAVRPSNVSKRNNATFTGRADAQPVMFGHGFGCDQTMWGRVAPEFEADRLVVLFDHVGCGAADIAAWSPRRHRTLRGYAQDLIELIAGLGLGPVSFVGHSASAMIGVLAAGERPELFRALVLVGGSARYLNDVGYVGGFEQEDVDGLLVTMESNFLAWSEATAPLAMGNPDRPELAEQLLDSFGRNQTRAAVSFARAIFLSDHRPDLRQVRTPTLVVQAAQDPMVPSSAAEQLHAGIAGSRYAQLDATGHFPHVSGPDETASVIRAFLDEVAPG